MLRKLACVGVALLCGTAQAQPMQWPADSARRFVTHCAGFHKELIAPCRCIFDGIQREISPEDFIKLTESDSIQQDARYKRITTDCATRAQVRG